ncbi:DASH family cryptochrome [Psychroserpens sp. Hel_I_66]|uniref:DASH family cryptochrome n=1 Tax=Psychroserpens sp. Hel_I_66 TaxID=1250004 RepID=UPI0006488CEE|nr:DASH family cryptochrome [Psychroserpens sp. Hel_I_66]
MTTGLVWFKNDLRLHDNEALCQAIANCDTLILCYCIDPDFFKFLDLGFRKSGINRFKFLEQSLLNLQEKLGAIGGHLIICNGKTEIELSKLIRKFSITQVYAEQEYADEELERIKNVETHCSNVSFNFYWGKTLYHIDDIPFKINKIPLTSKAYRIPTSEKSNPRATFESPLKINGHDKAKNSNMPDYSLFGFTEKDYDNTQPYVSGSEDEGLKRLQFYTFESQQLTGYRWTRNRSLGMDYSSKLSPYLALGCLSPREIYRVVKNYEITIKKNQSTWWLIFELVWRDYFTFKSMRIGHKIFHTKGFKNKSIAFENNLEKFKSWQNGKTGIPFIDAHMRQLNATGFMSNRGRVNCSSYFVHDLKIDWTWGAAYFESKLIDYDVSSNWLNWHVQAYEIWYTNPVNQSHKYKSQEFIRKWIPELEKLNDRDILTPWLVDGIDYPKPFEIFSKWSRSINKILKEVEI